MTARVIVARRLAGRPAAVFPAMIGLASQSRWIVATRLTALSGATQPPFPGAGMVARTGVGPMGFRDTMRVLTYQPPWRWEVRHVGPLVRGTGAFGILPSHASRRAGRLGNAHSTGCRVYWAEDLTLPFGFLGRFGWLLLRPLVRAGMALSLRRLDRGLRDGTLPAAGDAELEQVLR